MAHQTHHEKTVVMRREEYRAYRDPDDKERRAEERERYWARQREEARRITWLMRSAF